MLFSASRLKKWMTCPLQAHFDETLKRRGKTGAKTAYGSVIHDALEFYNRTGGDLEAAKARFKEVWRKPELIDVKIDYWEPYVTHNGLLKTGYDALELHKERSKWISTQVLAAEYNFCVPFGDHQIRGYIDRIDAIPYNNVYRLKIIDYKSGRKPSKAQLALDIQFTLYQYATMQPEFWTGFTDEKGNEYEGFEDGEELFKAFDGQERILVWYDLKDNKEITLPTRTDADFLRAYRLCEEVEKARQAKIFVPDISGDSCKWCDYTDVCEPVAPFRERFQEQIVDIGVRK